VTSQLHTDAGASVQLVVLSLVVVPNAVVFSGSYLLGPGFTVGTHTIVSPTVVTIGALPMFPLLAALPDTGPTPPWTAALIGGLLGGLVATWWQRRRLEPLESPSSDPQWLSKDPDDDHTGSLDDDPDATEAALARVPDEDDPA